MQPTSAAVSPSTSTSTFEEREVSRFRLYLLRAAYLLLVVGLGLMIVPVLIQHEPMARGVIPSLLGGVWLLAIVGVFRPLQMLPLLMFELVWKTIWLCAFGLPQWSAGHVPETFAGDIKAIGLGVILMPIVIPWGYVYRHYIKRA
jgi:hypothetical protein